MTSGEGLGSVVSATAYDGYEFLTEQSFPDAARICLTHSFPTKLVNEVAERWDGPLEQLEFTQAYLNEIELDDYDRLAATLRRACHAPWLCSAGKTPTRCGYSTRRK